jgi:hypothetical protein
VQLVAPTLGCVHVPSDAPEVMLHNPPQHSASCAHASPFCVQNDDGPQCPLALHSPEQHAAGPVPPAVHALPSVRHVVLSAAHLPLLQLPPQQSPFCEHDPLSLVQLF